MPLEVCASMKTVDSRRHSHFISSHSEVRSRCDFGLRRDPRG